MPEDDVFVAMSDSRRGDQVRSPLPGRCPACAWCSRPSRWCWPRPDALTTLSLFGYRVDGVIGRLFPAGRTWQQGWVGAQDEVLRRWRVIAGLRCGGRSVSRGPVGARLLTRPEGVRRWRPARRTCVERATADHPRLRRRTASPAAPVVGRRGVGLARRRRSRRDRRVVSSSLTLPAGWHGAG
jgi:hypothetical protein